MLMMMMVLLLMLADDDHGDRDDDTNEMVLMMMVFAVIQKLVHTMLRVPIVGIGVCGHSKTGAAIKSIANKHSPTIAIDPTHTYEHIYNVYICKHVYTCDTCKQIDRCVGLCMCACIHSCQTSRSMIDSPINFLRCRNDRR